MIPPTTLSGFLPPFVGQEDARAPAGRAPYRSTIGELVERFGTTPERRLLLRGLLNYRDDLRALGIVDGIQWIDGSFVEECEVNRGRPPSDIDVVTFLQRPPAHADKAAWNAHLAANQSTFQALQMPASKAVYRCDAYLVELNGPPLSLVFATHYWFGLFSHSRKMEWKGLVEIPLGSLFDDAMASAALNQMGVP